MGQACGRAGGGATTTRGQAPATLPPHVLVASAPAGAIHLAHRTEVGVAGDVPTIPPRRAYELTPATGVGATADVVAGPPPARGGPPAAAPAFIFVDRGRSPGVGRVAAHAEAGGYAVHGGDDEWLRASSDRPP
jgi:hypothetical protein